MTEPDKSSLLSKVVEPSDQDHERAWWQSKKFFAFLMAQAGFFFLMGAMIYAQEMDKLGENVSFMVLAVTSGFLAVGYIGGQAMVDRYVRVAALTMGRDPSVLDPNTESSGTPD